jgi:hypothetical protein
MRKNQNLPLSGRDKTTLAAIVLLIGAAIVGGMFGWIYNIITLVQSTGMTWGELAVRIIGVPFVPLGIVMGYI